jgi:hypothetical protein
MLRSVQFVTLLLIATVASAQHTAAFRGGSIGGFRFGAGRFGSPIIAGGHHGWLPGHSFNRRFGNFAGPYYPYLWAYPLIGDYSPDYYLAPPDDRPTNNTIIVQPSAPPMSPPRPAEPAHAEIREYKWNQPASAAGPGATTFTVVLKDGSKRYPAAAWVQDRNLHYIDSQGRQQILPSAVIDRDATERLNRRNNLSLQLPPG